MTIQIDDIDCIVETPVLIWSHKLQKKSDVLLNLPNSSKSQIDALAYLKT